MDEYASFELYLKLFLATCFSQVKAAYKNYISEEKYQYLMESCSDIHRFAQRFNINLEEFSKLPKTEVEQIILRNIFKTLVPSDSFEGSEEMGQIISDSLADIVALDFSKQYNIFLTYESDYYKYIVFLKEKLASLGSREDQLFLILRGNMKQLVGVLSKTEEEFTREFNQVGSGATEFDKLIQEIAKLSPNHEKEFGEILYKYSARANTKSQALSEIELVLKDIMPDILPQVQRLIDNYMSKESSISIK